MRIQPWLWTFAVAGWLGSAVAAEELVEMRGRVFDASTEQPLAARLYLRDADGRWHFAHSADPAGSAVSYDKQRSPESVEAHTSLSAHPFTAKLPPGQYTLVVERGKEYLAHQQQLEVRQAMPPVTVHLRRFIDMASRGWYSGETHVHRSLDELPNLVLAEDLNVALPLTYWVTQAFQPPQSGVGKSAEEEGSLIHVDPTHVIYPRNTEYEIFTVRGQRHTLGAVFALNHRSVFDRGVPPVRPIAEQVHREGGLLELDKHNWPWSMMLVPVMDIDLYELTNNHLWRTEFFFRQFGESPPSYMQIEADGQGMTERGWIQFTWQNYYTLLNCGFRLRPTAGTASGVHPVPLGFGRVYVHLPDGFSYAGWMEGLDAGRSFVTTGPLLEIRVDGQLPGSVTRGNGVRQVRMHGWLRSAEPLASVEIVRNGRVVHTVEPVNRAHPEGGYETPVDQRVNIDGSSWLALRCQALTPAGRIRFAHTAPFHWEIAGQPLRPRRAEVEYLIERIEKEVQRHEGVLPAEALAEYEAALAAYRGLLETAEN